MADNVPITAGSGTSIAADDIASVWYQRVKVSIGADGSATDWSSANPAPIRDDKANRVIIIAGSTLTRPANTTAYAANDSVSDNGTAASVTANTVTISDTNDYPIGIASVELHSTDTGFGAANVRLWIYNSDPTASSGVVNGDNAAFSNKKAGFVGTLSGTMRTFSDGSRGVLTPDEGSLLITLPGSGAKTLWWQLQTLSAATPSANSTTFIPTFRAYQAIP